MYEPYSYTTHKNHGKYTYPGKIDGEIWGREKLKNYMSAVGNFQKRHKILSNRILVGEFGCFRMARGVPIYFEHLTSIFAENKWHWAFYSFREDTWEGMDYELGDKQLPLAYWQALKRGKKLKFSRKEISQQFIVLKKALECPVDN
jgi:hypothetical protein